MGCGNMDLGHVVRLKTRVDLELVIVTMIMNVQGILLVEMITVWVPYFPHLRIVVKIHQQLLQPPQPLQQLPQPPQPLQQPQQPPQLQLSLAFHNMKLCY